MGIVIEPGKKITQGNAKMTSHEQTIESHVDNNVATAIDQSSEYGGMEKAFFAFMQNTVDSCIEDGYTAQEAFDAGDWFCVKFNKKTGMSL
jgi:predicted alpha/beta superfamily hydrolase